ncbi:MAG: radical SAM protein [Candidatus Aenigmarchaeota archaeon]|nr:radical SAM protein [Candidatus Aenigmarchaeota archaeon]
MSTAKNGSAQKFIIKGTPSYYQMKGEETGPFSYMTICLLGVTKNGKRVCNNNCIFCSNWERGRMRAGDSTLSKEDFSKIIPAFRKLGGKRIVTMGDGEPLYGENLDYMLEITKIAGEHGIGVTIFSNGRLLTKDILNSFDRLNDDVVFIININSLDKYTYEKTIRVPGSFEGVIENSRYWAERNARRIEITDHGIVSQFAITMVLSIANEGKIEDMKEFAEKCNAAFLCTSPMMTGSAEKNKSLIAPAIGDIRRLELLSQRWSTTKGPSSRNLCGTCGYIGGYASGKKLSAEPGGITFDLYGNARPCGYLLEGLEFNIRNNVKTVSNAVDALKKMNEIEDKILKDIYEKFGFGPCLMRHEKLPEIEEYLQSLRA